jgi:hypothetical protein
MNRSRDCSCIGEYWPCRSRPSDESNLSPKPCARPRPKRAGDRSPGVASEDTSELGELSGVVSMWRPRDGRCSCGEGECKLSARKSDSTCC